MKAVNYGKMIKKARNSKGIKANWVAKKLGVSISTYSEIENGKRKLTVERAEQIANILGITLGELLCPHISETLKTGTEGSR